jgi:adhesin/invasin
MLTNKSAALFAGALVATTSFAASAENHAKDMAVKAVSSAVSEKSEGLVSTFFARTELELKLEDLSKPEGSLLTVQPLYESDDLRNTVFTQGSLFVHDGGKRYTANLGLGLRHLSASEGVLFGLNTFYDREFPYDHGRTSFGLEVRSTAFEFNSNIYKGRTGFKAGRDGAIEKALGGHDVEVGAQVPYLPWAKVFAKKFQWDKAEAVYDDLKGEVYSLRLDAPMIDGLVIEAGRTSFDTRQDTDFVKLSYKLNFGQKTSEPNPLIVDNVAFRFGSMKDHRLDKVRRTNIIVKQVQFSATVSGV